MVFSHTFFSSVFFLCTKKKSITCRNKAEQLKIIENELKVVKTHLSDKEDRLISVQKSLDHERDEKMALLEEKAREEETWMTEKTQLLAERQELKQNLAEALEASKNDKSVKLQEAEVNEINQAYHKVIKDKESLENENSVLKQEVKRLQMIISSPLEIDQLRSSSAEDFGYSSSSNTLEKRHRKQGSLTISSQLSEGSEFYSLQHSHSQNGSTPSTFERKLKSFFGFSHSNRNHEGKTFLFFSSTSFFFFPFLSPRVIIHLTNIH